MTGAAARRGSAGAKWASTIWLFHAKQKLYPKVLDRGYRRVTFPYLETYEAIDLLAENSAKYHLCAIRVTRGRGKPNDLSPGPTPKGFEPLGLLIWCTVGHGLCIPSSAAHLRPMWCVRILGLRHLTIRPRSRRERQSRVRTTVSVTHENSGSAPSGAVTFNSYCPCRDVL